MSIPEDTPAEVIIPSSTTLRSLRIFVEGLTFFSSSKAPQCVGAFLFLSRPARAYSKEPVQTEVNSEASSAVSKIQEMVSFDCKSDLVPRPPGMRRMSTFGLSLKS